MKKNLGKIKQKVKKIPLELKNINLHLFGPLSLKQFEYGL